MSSDLFADAPELAPPTTLTDRSINEFSHALDVFAATHHDRPVPLDLRMKMRPEWGAVFANLLAGHYADLPLAVRFPTENSNQLQLARANVCFALARHARADFSETVRDHFLARWLQDWEPADVQQPLFHLDDVATEENAPKEMAKELVAYLNPDRLPRSQAAEDRDSVIRPWLSRLIGKPSIEYRPWRHQLYHDVSLSSMEVLDNIRDHSQLDDDGLCSLSLFTTTGGVGGKNDKLYLSVWDNGCGMPAAMAKHFPQGADPLEMVLSALNGTMPHKQRDRGRGLHRVTTLIERVGGDLFVATGPAAGGSIVIEHTGGQEAPVTGRVDGLPVRGTVIVMTLPLRPIASPDLGVNG